MRLAAPKSADVLDGVGALFLLGRAGQNTDSQNDYITWMIGQAMVREVRVDDILLNCDVLCFETLSGWGRGVLFPLIWIAFRLRLCLRLHVLDDRG